MFLLKNYKKIYLNGYMWLVNCIQSYDNDY